MALLRDIFFTNIHEDSYKYFDLSLVLIGCRMYFWMCWI